jgi:SnoaL-like domain
MTHLGQLQTWIDGYVTAWNSNDPSQIAALFTSDASYSTEPYKPAWHGRGKIIEGWLEHRDEPGETTFEWEPVAITPDVCVISGTTRYPGTSYSNLWVIKLADDGRCRSFAEWWMQHPA